MAMAPSPDSIRWRRAPFGGRQKSEPSHSPQLSSPPPPVVSGGAEEGRWGDEWSCAGSLSLLGGERGCLEGVAVRSPRCGAGGKCDGVLALGVEEGVGSQS